MSIGYTLRVSVSTIFVKFMHSKLLILSLCLLLITLLLKVDPVFACTFNSDCSERNDCVNGKCVPWDGLRNEVVQPDQNDSTTNLVPTNLEPTTINESDEDTYDLPEEEFCTAEELGERRYSSNIELKSLSREVQNLQRGATSEIVKSFKLMRNGIIDAEIS